ARFARSELEILDARRGEAQGRESRRRVKPGPLFGRQRSDRAIAQEKGTDERWLEIGSEAPGEHRDGDIEREAPARSALEVEERGEPPTLPEGVVAKQIPMNQPVGRGLLGRFELLSEPGDDAGQVTRQHPGLECAHSFGHPRRREPRWPEVAWSQTGSR